MSTNRPSDIQLPSGWTWERVEAERAKWDIADNMVPIATVSGVCCAWGTINSVRKGLGLSPTVVDVANLQEYGLTQKLSNPIRCF